MVKNYLSLIKFSHTIFAMPFAMIGYALAQQRYPSDRQIILLALVIICMISARSAAMAFNRYLDRDIDKSIILVSELCPAKPPQADDVKAWQQVGDDRTALPMPGKILLTAE